MGSVELFRDETFPEPNVIGHIPTAIETPFGTISPRYFTGPAIQDLIGDTGPPFPGGYLGCVRKNVKLELQLTDQPRLAHFQIVLQGGHFSTGEKGFIFNRP